MKQTLKLTFTVLFISLIFYNCKNESKKIDEPKTETEIKKLYVKDNNIHIVYENDKQKQITFNGSDEEPFFYKDKQQIIFTRNVPERNPYGEYQRKKLMIVSIDDFSERTITEKKPYKDGNDNSNEIFRIGNPTLSIDQESIYFTVEKWVTSDELVKVNIETGHWDELFGANSFEYIRNGSYKGQFIVTKSEIRDKGRAAYYMIVNEQDVVTKEFENESSVKEFLKIINNQR